MDRVTVAIYSGGMDSFTMVNELHRSGSLYACLSFDYGQRHKKELRYAIDECLRLGVEHQVLDLQSLQACFAGSALTDNVAVPEGHYQAESMKQTVVPNRNMVMLSIAIAYAVSRKLTYVAYGAHAGDHEIYPDCRPAFIRALNSAAEICDWRPVYIMTPYINQTKQGILRIGERMGLDYSRSWTCYVGGERACGKCGSCQERLEAFAQIGRKDPLEYAQ